MIPAAGVGLRLAGSKPKQYLEIGGMSIIEHTLARLCACEAVKGIVVGIAQNDDFWEKLGFNHKKLLGTFHGGSARVITVLNGLSYLSNQAGADDWVMVHDAVRPCVTLADIDLLIGSAVQAKYGAILASPVIDTIKRVNAGGGIENTLNRDELMAAMTPQLFPYRILHKALRHAVDQNMLTTDESAAVELLGHKPLAVRGCRSNIKITTIEDLRIAEMIIGDQKPVNE